MEPGTNMTDALMLFVAILVSLSVASERLVEIIKGFFPSLDQKNVDPTREGFRRAGIQLLGVVAGVATAFLARPALNQSLPQSFQDNSTPTFLALGFLTSGGSGLWNGILGYVRNVKDIKKQEVLKGVAPAVSMERKKAVQ